MTSHQDDHRYIGQPMKRREDPRLLTGAGRYVDDLAPPGCLHVVFVRSPHGHARIARLDTAAARRAPGVVAIVEGAEVAHLGPMPVNRLIPDMKIPPHPLIATGRVHAVGVPVAAVVADDPRAARDAADLIEVEYEPLAAVVDAEAALDGTAPALFPEVDGNRSFRRAIRQGDADRAFAAAAHRVALRVEQARLSAVAIEPRAVLASFDPMTEELTLWVSCQAPFRIRAEVARLLAMPEARVRVIAPDVGGGFGVKSGPYREEVVLAWLAPRLRRPLKWIATRGEDIATTSHARGMVCEGELALDSAGRILALRARVAAPLGASLLNAAAGSPWNHARLLPGAYEVPACDIEVIGRGHHHGSSRRLSRRGAAGGLLLHRAPDGHRRARGGPRPGGDPAPQLHPGRRLPLSHGHRSGLRLRRLSAGPRPRAGGRGLCGAAGDSSRSAASAARSWAWDSRATWSRARWAGRAEA